MFANMAMIIHHLQNTLPLAAEMDAEDEWEEGRPACRQAAVLEKYPAACCGVFYF